MKTISNRFNKVTVVNDPYQWVLKKQSFESGDIQVVFMLVRQKDVFYLPNHSGVRKFAERHSAVNQDLTIKKDCVALRAC